VNKTNLDSECWWVHFNTEDEMKYSMNYYPKRKREFHDSYNQIPEIFETLSLKERERTTEGKTEKVTGKIDFVVPWQLP
jgi:hypothetical protein